MKITAMEGEGFRLSNSKAKDVVAARAGFEDLVGKVRREYSRAVSALVDEQSKGERTPEEAVANVVENSTQTMDETLSERQERIEAEASRILSEQDVRELAGVLNPVGSLREQIEALEATANEYRLKALNGHGNEMRERFYKSVGETAELKADSIRIKEWLKPIHDEALSILKGEVETNDLNRLERFKKWVKRNAVGLSGTAITIAGTITAVAVSAGSAIVRGAQATSRFAKALANIGRNLGSRGARVLSIMSTIISSGARGLLWLSQNIWALAIALAFFVYSEYTRRWGQR